MRVSKYQAYPEYRHTGVEWLPEMPLGWSVTKLKYLIKSLESGVSVNAGDYPKSEGEVGVLKTSCVYTREFRSEENKTVFVEETIRVKCPVKADSIIISRMNTPDLVGAAAYVDRDYKDLYLPDRLWQTVYNNEDSQSSKYIHYFMYLRGFRDQISNYAEGASSSMQNIAKEDFLSINLLLPTRVEQEIIASFLDHETNKIDNLIEKQQHLIKLLKEKRQAVISHAITKGLNSDVPMCDSGVEWLGEVPKHWIVTKLGQLAFMQEGPGLRTWQFKRHGIRVICVTNITERGINFEKLEKFISEEEYLQSYKHFTVDRGDILLSSSGNSWGKVASYKNKEKTILNTSTIRLKELPHKPLALAYIKNFLLSEPCKEQLGVAMTGSCQRL